MKPLAALLTAMSLSLATGCGGPSADDSVNTEESNGSCPSSPQVLTGKTANGGSCTDYEDCLPICCPCPGLSGDEYLAAECIGGKCNSNAATCNDTDDQNGLCS